MQKAMAYNEKLAKLAAALRPAVSLNGSFSALIWEKLKTCSFLLKREIKTTIAIQISSCSVPLVWVFKYPGNYIRI